MKIVGMSELLWLFYRKSAFPKEAGISPTNVKVLDVLQPDVGILNTVHPDD